MITESWTFVTVIILAILLVNLSQNTFSYAKSESNRITQPEQNTSSSEIGEPEKVTTTGGIEEKIRCPNGSLANTGTECSSSEECPAEPSENLTKRCIQPSQRNSSNTNATNASSIAGLLPTP